MAGAGLDERPDIAYIINRIFQDTGDRVSVDAKLKTLNKFGTNLVVGTSFETISQFQSTTANETFVSTNIIDSIASTNELADVGITVTIEGHTIDSSGNLTFVIQNATLHATDARTEVTLTTPLARASRMFVANSGTFNSPQATPTGNIYVYDNTDGQTNGVPTTAAATKLMILADETQSEKCATSISQYDYWILTGFSGGLANGGGSADEVTLRLQKRDIKNGGVWLPEGRDKIITVAVGAPPPAVFDPLTYIKPNHDVRMVGKTDANTAAVFANMQGYLAIIL